MRLNNATQVKTNHIGENRDLMMNLTNMNMHGPMGQRQSSSVAKNYPALEGQAARQLKLSNQVVIGNNISNTQQGSTEHNTGSGLGGSSMMFNGSGQHRHTNSMSRAQVSHL